MDVKHKIDKLARDNRAQEREKLIDEIRSQCGMPRSEKKKRKLTTNKLVAIVSCCAVAVCAAIIIPCVLLLGGDGSKDRYCVSSEIVQQPSEYNIKQYNELHGTSILYLDWYEEPNISYMLEIKLKENNENIGISETLMNLSTSDSVKVQLTKKNIHIDYLDEIAKICGNKNKIKNISVDWGQTENVLSAVFVNGDYRYYVTLDNSANETRFFEILTELLEEK